MKLSVNNSAIEPEGSTVNLEQAVIHSGVKDFKGLAVAVNNTVIPRTNWSSFQLNENDTITIIHATQGG